MNPADTFFQIAAWPDGRVLPRLCWWAQSLGIAPHQCRTVVLSPVEAAYNTMVANFLGSRYTWGLFADCDVRPLPGDTDQMFALDADICCVEYPTRSHGKWTDADEFHTGIWCASRDALLRIGAPWFAHTFNATGTRPLSCVCDNFRRKALAAGLTVAHGGKAEHTFS